VDVRRDRALIIEKKYKSSLNKSLQIKNIELSKEWHPTKNGKLTPSNMPACSNEKVWWLGKCGHEWEATINSRTTGGNGCPICDGKQVLTGFNDLATRHPELAAQWHPTKNGNLEPTKVAAGSNKKIWWSCEKCNYSWCSTVSNRVRGTGCPVCAGKLVLPGFNDLATKQPDLAAQWHPTKNKTANLYPDTITPGSHKIVWWVCSKCGHEWKAAVYSRSNGNGCPNCYNIRRSKKISCKILGTDVS